MYPCIAVEHSYNCMVLLCSLFFWPSGHYTKSVPYALNGQYIYNYIAAHYTYQNNVVGVIPICVKVEKGVSISATIMWPRQMAGCVCRLTEPEMGRTSNC